MFTGTLGRHRIQGRGRLLFFRLGSAWKRHNPHMDIPRSVARAALGFENAPGISATVDALEVPRAWSSQKRRNP